MSLFSVKCLMEQVREHVNQRLGKGCSAFADDQSEEYEVFLEQLNQSIDDGRFAPAESAEGKTCRIVFSITPLSEDVSVPTSSSSSMPPPPPPLKRKKEVVNISDISDDEDDEVVEVEKKKKAIIVTSSESAEPMPSTSKQKVAPTCNVTDEELARMMTICEEEWVWDDFLGNHPPKNQKQ